MWILWTVAAIATWILHPISLSAIRLSSPVVFIALIAQLPAEDFGILPVAVSTAALIALLVIAWATGGGGAGKIGELFDRVIDSVTSKLP